MKKLIFAIGLMLATLSLHAQQLQVATGKAGDTYSTMLKQLAARCGSAVAIIEHNSGGSNDNIDRLVGNQVNAAFVQSDVLWLRARTEDLGGVKTLMTLHPEQVHLVARAVSGKKEGGVLGIGGSAVVFADLASLAGRKIGAAGGSLVTAKVIRLQSEVPFNVVQYDNGDQVMAALIAGDVDAALFVGGAPLATVAKLDNTFKLLAISGPTAEKLKGVYRPAVLNYSRMNAAGVPTVAVDAVFATREYKTARMTDGLAKLRACALASIDDLRETVGMHPAWQRVDPNNRGKWPWLDLGGK